MLGILRAFLRGEPGLCLDLLFLDPHPHLEGRDADRGEGDQHPYPACDVVHVRQVPLVCAAPTSCRYGGSFLQAVASSLVRAASRARRRGRSASIWAAVSAPRSVTICSRTRTRCSSSVEREAYWAAISAALPASTSSFFSRNLKKRLNIS